MDDTVRQAKEDFVTGHGGTTLGDLLLTLISVITVSISLHRGVLVLVPPRWTGPFGLYLAETLALIVPIAVVLPGEPWSSADVVAGVVFGGEWTHVWFNP
jgi:hypothetical protein